MKKIEDFPRVDFYPRRRQKVSPWWISILEEDRRFPPGGFLSQKKMENFPLWISILEEDRRFPPWWISNSDLWFGIYGRFPFFLLINSEKKTYRCNINFFCRSVFLEGGQWFKRMSIKTDNCFTQSYVRPSQNRLKSLEWWITRSMLDPLFFLISRLT